jgi:hypothetical protein
MIKSVVETIRQQLSERFALAGAEISVLKLSTPNSGKGPFSKVIFLLFKNSESAPFVCVKTVRCQADNATIEEAYKCLERIEPLVAKSSFIDFFPKPLLITHDADGIAWSAETACVGRRADKHDYEQIYRSYTAEQLYLYQHHQQTAEVSELVQRYLTDLQLSGREYDSLMQFYRQLTVSGAEGVPLIPQHGDFTLDNIVIAPTGVQIYDCERFGQTDVAGYDIFQLLTRWSKHDSAITVSGQVKHYFDQLGLSELSLQRLIFLYVVIEFWFKKQAQTEPIAAEAVIERYRLLTS